MLKCSLTELQIHKYKITNTFAQMRTLIRAQCSCTSHDFYNHQAPYRLYISIIFIPEIHASYEHMYGWTHDVHQNRFYSIPDLFQANKQQKEEEEEVKFACVCIEKVYCPMKGIPHSFLHAYTHNTQAILEWLSSMSSTSLWMSLYNFFFFF